MNILVCISKTPDTTAKIAFSNNNTQFNKNGVTFIMNPTDEWYALVRAIEVKEQQGGTVTVINVGGRENDTIIRKALAIGADKAVRINAEPVDAFTVATHINAFARQQRFDLIFTGKETIDYNGFSVAGMLAELLDLPYIPLATKMDLAGKQATIEREIEGGIEVVSVATPFVLSCQKGIAEQRIPNMRGIMMARRKPLQVINPPALAPTAVIKVYELPPARQAVKLVDPENPAELVRLLHEEAKVI